MGCKHCQNGKHGKCIRRNADKITGCPCNCQHRGTKHAIYPGKVRLVAMQINCGGTCPIHCQGH